MSFFNSLGFNINLKATNNGKDNYKQMKKMENDFVFVNVFAKLINEYMNSWDIDGAPDTFNVRIFKESLLWNGDAAGVVINNNLLAFPVQLNGSINANGEPGGGFAYTKTGDVVNVKFFIPGADNSNFLKKTIGTTDHGPNDGFYIRENNLAYPFIRTIYYYAAAISDAYRTVDTARNNIKQPYIILSGAEQTNSVKRLMENRDNNVPYINLGQYTPDSIKIESLDINPAALDAAAQAVDWLENKWREELGINSLAQIDKKGENLIAEEVNANDEITDLHVTGRLAVIQQGLDLINENLGLNMKVTPTTQNKNIKEVEDNEDVQRDSGDN